MREQERREAQLRAALEQSRAAEERLRAQVEQLEREKHSRSWHILREIHEELNQDNGGGVTGSRPYNNRDANSNSRSHPSPLGARSSSNAASSNAATPPRQHGSAHTSAGTVGDAFELSPADTSATSIQPPQLSPSPAPTPIAPDWAGGADDSALDPLLPTASQVFRSVETPDAFTRSGAVSTGDSLSSSTFFSPSVMFSPPMDSSFQTHWHREGSSFHARFADSSVGDSVRKSSDSLYNASSIGGSSVNDQRESRASLSSPRRMESDSGGRRSDEILALYSDIGRLSGRLESKLRRSNDDVSDHNSNTTNSVTFANSMLRRK